MFMFSVKMLYGSVVPVANFVVVHSNSWLYLML